MRIPQLAFTLLVLQSPATCGMPDVGLPSSDRVGGTVRSSAAVGTYSLVAANGRALPYRYEDDDGCRESIESGRLVLRANGSYQWSVTTQENCDGEIERETEEEDGEYDVSGNRIRFDDEFDEDDEGEEDDGFIEGAQVRFPTEDFGDDEIWLTFRR